MTLPVKGYLQRIPLFTHFSDEELEELTSLFHEKDYPSGQLIVKENDPVDSLFLILDGEVEISVKNEVVAVLHAGETLGLSETGFYSKTGLRTATAKAISDVKAAVTNLNDFKNFLEKHPSLTPELRKESKHFLRQYFLKQVEPFQKIDHTLVKEVADQLEEKRVEGGHIFFKEGDLSDCCYLLCEGTVEVIKRSEEGDEVLDELAPFELFGELGVLTASKRNATIKAKTACDVLILKKGDLQKLLQHSQESDLFILLMMHRIRPKQVEGISVHKRKDAKNNTVVILKNEKQGAYFKTTEEGLFIWNLLDGNHTLKDISVAFFFQFHKLIVDDIGSFVIQLIGSGFIETPFLTADILHKKASFWNRFFSSAAKILTFTYSFKNIDQRLTRLYNSFGYLFYTLVAKVIMTLLAIVGIVHFILVAGRTESILIQTRHSWSFFLFVSLTTLLTVPLHELAHALTTKSYGRSVHRAGVGWFWIGGIAFVDSSDMWLCPRGPRIMVNLAGIYINVVIAGILSILAWVISGPISAFLWLAALSNYMISFYNLTPIIELDGYYVLMDAFDKSNLRGYATKWVLKIRKFTKEYLPEICYWIACILFILASAIISYFIQNHVLVAVLPDNVRHFFVTYLKYTLFILVLILSFWKIFRKVK